MNWLGLVFISAVILAVAYLMWYNRRRKDVGGRDLELYDFTKIGYNINQMDPVTVERIGNRLREIYRRVWPELNRIYGSKPEFFLTHIIFDQDFEERTEEGGRIIFRKVIKLVMPGNMITMRPQGGGGRTAEYWFALEINNLHRGLALGIDKIYPNENSSDEEMRLWREAQEACKAALA